MTHIFGKIPSRLRRATGAVALVWLIAAPAGGAMAAQDPAAFVANLGTQGIQALGPGVPSAERVARLSQLFHQDFDITGIGFFALGRYRYQATPQEQQEFFRLYPDFTVRAFGDKLDQFGGLPFHVIGGHPIGDETLVNSEVVRANGSRVQMDWYLSGNGGQYRITDVTVGGVSMKLALRDAFASWIQKNGGRFDALIAVLRQQLAQY